MLHEPWRCANRRKILRLARALALLGAIETSTTLAYDFDWDDLHGSVITKVTAGAAMRVENRDYALIGKLNVPGQQTLCQADDCMSLTGDPAPNQRLKNARGGYSEHENDDGDLNYDRGDFVAAISKFNVGLSAHWDDLTTKVTYVGYFDAINHDFRETHTNTLYQPAKTKRSSKVDGQVGLRGEFREAFVQYTGSLWDRNTTISIGAQRVRWGESNLHIFNTLDVINPQDGILSRQPGFALNELNIPTHLALFDMDLVDGVSAEVFYQYHWNKTRPEPDGSYFSSSDVVGGTYIEAAPGQFAEDPQARYKAPAPLSLLTAATRRVLVGEHSPRNQGEYGIRLSWLAQDFNGGTEFGLYYANYHSRLPYLSVIESDPSCTRRAALPANFLAAVAACSNATGIFNGTLQTAPSVATEPLPVDTEKATLRYPEDIHMIGASFNTTVLGWSVSGEYAYRPNLPAQIQFSDVLFAGVQQAFPAQDIPIISSSLPGLLGATVPGARTFVPDFISTHRGRTIANNNEFQPGEFVRGWERLKVGQFVLNGIKVFTGPLGSDDLTWVIEGGFTHVIHMPKDIYFQGQAEGTHPGPGADGSGPGPQTTLRLNPTQQTAGFATSFAWGLRSLVQMNYSNVWNSGITLKPTLLWFEDIQGIAPFPMQNYVEGNRWITGGLQYLIGQNIEGSVLYMYFDGRKNPLRDRDNVQFSISYTF